MAEKLRLALEWFLNPDHVPFLVGLELGWFAEAGIDLELVEPKEHFDAFAGMRDGVVDVAITEPIHLLQDLARGESMVGFTRFLHTNGGVMVLERSGITRPREMAGCRVQYPGAPGPGGPAIVNTMIQADGGEPGALVPVNHGFFHTNALAEGLADAATLVFYNFEVVEAQHRGLSPRLFALKDWGVPDFCQLILVTLPGTLAAREATMRALVRVMRRGIDFLHQRPAEAAAIYARRTGGAPSALGDAIFAATVPCFTHDFSMSHDYYRALDAWLIRTGQSDRPADVRAAWTNALAW
jgi:putative hydroxymethylpyrimidine transport system substrate-binding protein